VDGLDLLKSSSFEQVIETVEALPLDEQQMLIDIIHHRLVEARRGEIAQNAADTLRAIRERRVSFGDLDDLQKDLENQV
jgi:hypothetical protein